MKIRRKPELITTTGLIIAGVVLVILIALAVIGWSLIATSAEQDFSNRISDAKKSITAEINTKVAELSQVIGKHDTAKTADYMESFATAVDADVVNIPQQTYFAGLPLVGSARLAQADAIKSKLNDLATALHASSALASYESNVLEPLVGAKNLFSSDLTEEQKMAQTWSGLVQQLQGMQVPDIAKDVHTTVLNLVVSIAQALNQLPAATQKQDQGLQEAIASALNGYVGQLQHLGPTVKEISQQADQNLNEALKAAQDVLQ